MPRLVLLCPPLLLLGQLSHVRGVGAAQEVAHAAGHAGEEFEALGLEEPVHRLRHVQHSFHHHEFVVQPFKVVDRPALELRRREGRPPLHGEGALHQRGVVREVVELLQRVELRGLLHSFHDRLCIRAVRVDGRVQTSLEQPQALLALELRAVRPLLRHAVEAAGEEEDPLEGAVDPIKWLRWYIASFVDQLAEEDCLWVRSCVPGHCCHLLGDEGAHVHGQVDGAADGVAERGLVLRHVGLHQGLRAGHQLCQVVLALGEVIDVQEKEEDVCNEGGCLEGVSLSAQLGFHACEQVLRRVSPPGACN
mmetsp:Transcript_120826/g.352978  ORF Transcript_120826/g.352978 Transcript_120826/m.352978 type:complete len:307 (-) Transcript_120826:1316-2236(-)